MTENNTGNRWARLPSNPASQGRTHMVARTAIGAAVFAALLLPLAAQAFDETRYPDLKGQWRRSVTDAPRYDTSKPPGPGQQAPLTAEYQALYDANLKAIAAGGPGNDPTLTCVAPGMPRAMNGDGLMEVVVTPHTTYMLIQNVHDSRRIYTDGRDWPAEMELSYAGTSMGKWIDTDGDGRFDLLEVETRGFKGPRVFDATGIPLHKDNETVIKERIYLDKADRNVLRDEITTIDKALTRPWTVTKSFLRDPARSE